MLNSTHTKNVEGKKNGDWDGKALYKLMNIALYGRTMENLINTIDVKTCKQQKGYLKWTSKPSHMSHRIFDNDLVLIRKNITLTFTNAYKLH